MYICDKFLKSSWLNYFFLVLDIPRSSKSSVCILGLAVLICTGTRRLGDVVAFAETDGLGVVAGTELGEGTVVFSASKKEGSSNSHSIVETVEAFVCGLGAGTSTGGCISLTCFVLLGLLRVLLRQGFLLSWSFWRSQF